MIYSNLHDLIFSSDSSMKYFTSLPVSEQEFLHSIGEHIHTAQQLHLFSSGYDKYLKQLKISQNLDLYF